MEEIVFRLRTPLPGKTPKNAREALLQEIKTNFPDMDSREFKIVCAMMKYKGQKFVGEVMRETIKNPKAKDKKAYFISIILKQKIDFKPLKQG